MTSKQIGIYCENICKNYLINLGYNIIEMNYHSRYGEIDIIAKNTTFLIFVEVKARLMNSVIRAHEAVDKRKMKKIIKTAYKFLSENKFELQPRFDICELYFLKDDFNNKVEIKRTNYIENAFDISFIDLDIKL